MVVFRGCLDIRRILVAKSGTDRIRTVLKKKVNRERDEWNNDTEDPLKSRQSVDVHRDKSAEKLGAENLNNQNDDPNDDEGGVLENAVKYVELVIDLSGANHIENLHEDE